MADKKSQTSTITINFVTNAVGELYLNIELDDEKNGSGVSEFKFGSTAYFKVYTNADNVECYPTAGTSAVETADVDEKIKDEYLTFTVPAVLEDYGKKKSDNTATLAKEAKEGTLTTTKISSHTFTVSLGEDGQTLTASDFGVGVVKANYTTQFDRYTLSGVTAPTDWPAGDSFPVAVVLVAY